MSNVGRGTPAEYVKVTGRGFAGEARGDDLHVRAGEVVLESTGKQPAVRYTALGIAVYQDGRILRASWEFDVKGELTSANPKVTLTTAAFDLPGAGSLCLLGGCEVRLQLRVELDADRAHAEHTDFAALTVRRVAVAPKPVPGKRQQKGTPVPQTIPGWEYRLILSATAIREQRYRDAELLLGEALRMVEKTQGAGRPGAARVQYWTAHLHDQQKNAAEQERALLAALGILEKFPDAEVQKAIGKPGGELDKEIVARRLGDFYWSQQRYDRSFEYFDRAYRYVADVAMPIEERNRRLTLNSAGKMATACLRQDWPATERALKELKQRIVHVDPDTRTRLESWVRMGEQGLAARKC